ncbi:DUF58 domain-containing protein [Halosquirtibacter laminarini]|uniref:DUF58 domain-containing protein n=1 Tax=Halosquirtibacter laminarini TaxID=3374600 RepID=A0AC61NI06_9BACT|nr:DUF58 domain-containing protein [Prolixibacteraceae bacterium]
METSELLKKVRKIEIKSRGLSKNIFAGEYHSAFKGRGMAFSEVREYQFGDDVRSIDWNVTARYNKPFIKIFEEERELTVMLLVDVSGSRDFGTLDRWKHHVITEISAVLSFSAIANNDKIGVIFFSDKIEKFIPPQKGKSHTLRIIRELIDFQPESEKTDITLAVQYLSNVIKRRCSAFIISDFIDNNRDLEKALMIANKKHDLAALRIYDRRETELPAMGLVKFKDSESGAYVFADTSSRRTRNHYKQMWYEHEQRMDRLFAKSGVDSVSINTEEDFVKALISLFRKRA